MAAKKKTSMLFPHEWVPILETFSPEKANEIIMALVKYDMTGEEPELEFDNALERVVFAQMVQTVRDNLDAYDEKCERNKANGSKGGRPKNDEEKKKPNGFSKNPKKPNGFSEKPKKPDNDVDSDVDRDRDSDCDNDRDRERERDSDKDVDVDASHPARAREAASASPVAELSEGQIKEIIETWNKNKVTKDLIGIHRMSAREENTRICISRCGYDNFILSLCKVDDQAFFRKMKDENKLVKFDWFIKPENFQKFLEGNYEDEWKPPEAEKKKSEIDEWEVS